jgi:hypothetical protein
MIETMLAGDKVYLLHWPPTTTATSAAPAASFKRAFQTFGGQLSALLTTRQSGWQDPAPFSRIYFGLLVQSCP